MMANTVTHVKLIHNFILMSLFSVLDHLNMVVRKITVVLLSDRKSETSELAGIRICSPSIR